MSRHQYAVWIPGPLPPTSLNSRTHFQATAKLVREAKDRALAHIHERDFPTPFPTPCYLHYGITIGTRRRMDIDNLVGRLKPFLDALVEVGIIPDDDIRTIPRIAATATYDKDAPGVLIVLTGLPDA